MTREERKIYQFGVIVAAAFIIAAVIVLTASKNVAYAAPTVADEEIMAESTAAAETADLDANSGMPCVDSESFRRWCETYEPETVKEERTDSSGADDEGDGTEPEASWLSETRTGEVESSVPTLYKIAGQEIDEGIQIKLYQHLQEAGIEYWYEGALCQMFQESHGQVYAENPNGLDKGLYQFRITYWNWSDGDIFDVDAQLSRYAPEMAARFNAGLSTEEAISRHNTSDYVAAVNWEYVGQVKQWIGQMEVVSK